MSATRSTHWFILFIAVAVYSPPVLAHKASDSYLTIQCRDHALRGEWHLSLRDLNNVLDLDTDGDGAITWGELRAQKAAVFDYARSHLQLSAAGVLLPLRVVELLVDTHSDGAYAVLRFTLGTLGSATNLQVRYDAFFDIDRLHRGLCRIETAEGVRTAVFGPLCPEQQLPLGRGAPTAHPLAFVREGVWHIWTGYDHLLFLFALLLPSGLRMSVGRWEPHHSLRPVMREVFRVVTAFTLAHSITLTLAALGWVRLPPRGVECAIAASVVLAALNNVWPAFQGRAWAVAFGFGLIHGFGFANALADLGLRHTHLAETLLGFNLGVEVGQSAIVAGLLPLLFALRRRALYQGLILPASSCVIALTAAAWFMERLLDVKWLPF